MPEGGHQRRAAAHPAQRPLRLLAQLRDVPQTQVGQLVLREIASEILGGIHRGA